MCSVGQVEVGLFALAEQGVGTDKQDYNDMSALAGIADVAVDWLADDAAAEPDEHLDKVGESPEHFLQAHASPATQTVGELGSCDWASEHATSDKGMPYHPAEEYHVRGPAQMQSPDLRTPQPAAEGRRGVSSSPAATLRASAAAAAAAEPTAGTVEVVRTVCALAQAVQSTVNQHMQRLTAVVEEQGHALAGGLGPAHACGPGPMTPEPAEPASRLPQPTPPAEPAPAATAAPASGRQAAAEPQQMHPQDGPTCCPHRVLGSPVHDALIMGDENSSDSMTWRSDSPGVIL